MQAILRAFSSASVQAPVPNRKPEGTKIAQCAKEFEGMLIGQMLRSAREATPEGDNAEDDDDSNSTLIELGEQQLGQALAANGTLGIAKIVVAGLVKNAD